MKALIALRRFCADVVFSGTALIIYAILIIIAGWLHQNVIWSNAVNY